MTLFFIDEQYALANSLARALNENSSVVDCHRFPDGETCVWVDHEAVTDSCIVVASLAQPESNTLPLVFLARTLRDYGASNIVLVAPYLPYMRQDKRFQAGEGISARYYGELLSNYFEGLVTVDPHLHRIHQLDEIYTINTHVVESARSVAAWVGTNIDKPLIVGPDSESEQWAAKLAGLSNAPHIILEKTRHGDREVEISVPNVEQWLEHTPVLFDDIISTGKTMSETIGHLKAQGMKPPVCIGVHAVFADGAYRQLLQSGAERVVTCNTIGHESNGIDLTSPIAAAVQQLR